MYYETQLLNAYRKIGYDTPKIYTVNTKGLHEKVSTKRSTQKGLHEKVYTKISKRKRST